MPIRYGRSSAASGLQILIIAPMRSTHLIKILTATATAEPGMKTTEIAMELIIKPSDPTIGQLYEAYENNEAVDILRWVDGGRSTRNWYSITEMSESAAYDDASILSLTLTGKGEPTVIEDMADPRESA